MLQPERGKARLECGPCGRAGLGIRFADDVAHPPRMQTRRAPGLSQTPLPPSRLPLARGPRLREDHQAAADRGVDFVSFKAFLDTMVQSHGFDESRHF